MVENGREDSAHRNKQHNCHDAVRQQILHVVCKVLQSTARIDSLPLATVQLPVQAVAVHLTQHHDMRWPVTPRGPGLSRLPHMTHLCSSATACQTYPDLAACMAHTLGAWRIIAAFRRWPVPSWRIFGQRMACEISHVACRV